MPEKAWWISALQWALWGVAMTLVMGWLGKCRLRSRPAAEARRLVHPTSTLIIGLTCFILFSGFAIASALVLSNEPALWWALAVFVPLALLSAPAVSGFFLEAHEVSEEGLAFRNFLGARKHLRWSELGAVRYAPVMKWFRLETRSGTVARVSIMLMGLPEFAALLLRHAPHAAIDSATAEALRATAAGNPPSLWS